MNDQQQHATPPVKFYAVVELFGHQRIAGQVTEQVFGGASMIRVDVPEVVATFTDYEESPPVRKQRLIQAHSRSFGAGAIYSINWCDEATAVEAAKSIRHEPLQPYAAKAAVQNVIAEARTTPALAHSGGHDDDLPY